MKTNPRHLDLLSDFFKDSEDGWAHVITTLGYGVTDVQLHRIEDSPVIVLKFRACESSKVILSKRGINYVLNVIPVKCDYYPPIVSGIYPLTEASLLVENIGKLIRKIEKTLSFA